MLCSVGSGRGRLVSIWNAGLSCGGADGFSLVCFSFAVFFLPVFLSLRVFIGVVEHGTTAICDLSDEVESQLHRLSWYVVLAFQPVGRSSHVVVWSTRLNQSATFPLSQPRSVPLATPPSVPCDLPWQPHYVRSPGGTGFGVSVCVEAKVFRF